ncbi:hypothetical protein GSI_03277 [Ganoderma sinense ZZ0214-1]|uniref:Uncharacterized protein n=1 Tax=Ganoderma sinense ZZ0214-1 TaxID=1077348 RepID=A0A2G8SL74_9APHY|nr:hypothetical protein GSI_03277 [Ganoderma sinense ZZ0214-1]
MSMPDSWNAIFQNCWYVGNNFNCIMYGVELVLYFFTVKHVVDSRTRRRQQKGKADAAAEPASIRAILYLSTGLLCMITIYLFAQNFFGEEMWIINEGYTGGSGQYYASHAAVWYQTMGSASSVVMNWMSDGYLVRGLPSLKLEASALSPQFCLRALIDIGYPSCQIYRTYVIWDGKIFVIIVPAILYIGTVVLGILTCYYSGRPGGDFFVGIAPHIALAYSTVGIAMNVICSSLICGYIVYHTHRFIKLVGRRDDNDNRRRFNHVLEIIVEAMLPYTLSGAAYVTLLGLNSPVAILFLSLYVMFTCLSPQIIMLRVVLGREWRNELTLTGEPISDLNFAKGSIVKSQVDTGAFTIEAIALPDLARGGDTSRSLSVTHVRCSVEFK